MGCGFLSSVGGANFCSPVSKVGGSLLGWYSHMGICISYYTIPNDSDGRVPGTLTISPSPRSGMNAPGSSFVHYRSIVQYSHLPILPLSALGGSEWKAL